MSLAGRPAVARLRRAVNRAGFDITRQPFSFHFVRVLQGRGITCVVDIGANTGQYGVELRASGFTGDVLSVEPLAAAYAALLSTAAGDPRWRTLRSAVGDVTGTLELNVAGNSVSSSPLPMLDLHADAAPEARYVGTETVPATTVDALVADHGLDPAVTLLKVDVQGYESVVLDGARATLSSFAAVQLELSLAPLYGGSVLMPEQVARMDAAGFDLWLVDPAFYEPGTGRLLQCDGLFVRR